MPALLLLLVGGGFGAYFGAQGDDAIETATGERGGIPWLQLAILLGAGFLLWRKFK